MRIKSFAMVAVASFVSTSALASPAGLLATKSGMGTRAAPAGTLASLLTTLRSELKNPPIPSLGGAADLPMLLNLPSLGAPLVSTLKNDAGQIVVLVGAGRPLEVVGSSGVVLDSYVSGAVGPAQKSR